MADRGEPTVTAGDLERQQPATRWSSLVGGAVAGLAGLGVFLALHATWIRPIWFVAGLGLVVAVVGGAATGWAYALCRYRIPAHPVTAWLSIAGVVVVILAPAFVLSWALGPYVPIVDGVPVMPSDAALPGIAARFVLEFLVVTTATGAGIGWLVTRSGRAAAATGSAALAFALGPGHNNPFFFTFGSPAALLTGMGLMLAVIVTSSAVLVAIDQRLAVGPA